MINNKSVLLSIATTALLAGCAGNNRAVLPIADLSSASQAIGTSPGTAAPSADEDRLAYVSEAFYGTVTGFDRSGQRTVTISGLSQPIGMVVDAAHHLLVANSGLGNVLVFARGATMPFKILAEPGQTPVDVTVCPNGTVYVANWVRPGQTGQGNIAAFAHGSTTPTSWLHDPKEIATLSVTCDARNNVFSVILYAWPFASVAEKYVGGKQNGLVRLPQIPLQAPFFASMKAIGPNIIVTDQISNTAREYTEDGQPTGRQLYEVQMGLGIAVSRDGKVLLGAEAGDVGGAQSFLFPSGTPRHVYGIVNSNDPYGVAFDPDAF